jgi:hypothetical protein
MQQDQNAIEIIKLLLQFAIVPTIGGGTFDAGSVYACGVQ